MTHNGHSLNYLKAGSFRSSRLESHCSRGQRGFKLCLSSWIFYDGCAKNRLEGNRLWGKEIAFGLDKAQDVTTQADFTYSITDTGKGGRSVTNDIEAVLRKIEYWHQGSITGFRIMYCDETGV